MLGAVLVESGSISEDQLRIALLEQGKCGFLLGRLLVELGFVEESAVREALCASTGQTSVDLAHVAVDAETLGMVPQELARRHHLLPIALDREEQQLTLAMADTFNVPGLDQVRALHGGTIRLRPLLAGEADILRAIDHLYGFELSMDGILREMETGEIDCRSLQSGNSGYSQPVVRLVDAILVDAVQQAASDIHFEPEQGFVRIRYRVDGVLRQVRSLHRKYWPAMVVRIKVICSMNIAENRAPQDGRFSMSIGGRGVDFRAATQPTIHGENIVLRVLDRRRGIVSLDGLGLSADNLALLGLMLARPEGVLLVSGPTGSGKTTTLYSILNHLNRSSVNIMTMEDPVEYPMPMLRQTSVNESAKMGFAEGVRSMLRQDPDIILVGEIRDLPTAEMTFRAAMTGHQVYSTLHAGSAVGAVPRLRDIGVLPGVLAESLIGVIAQRLVRRLCPHCRRPAPDRDPARRLRGPGWQEQGPGPHEPVGCESCNHQGYKGRAAIMELLRIDEELADLIVRGAGSRALRAAARAGGFRTLAEDGVGRVLDGTTSLEELGRVVDMTQLLNSG